MKDLSKATAEDIQNFKKSMLKKYYLDKKPCRKVYITKPQTEQQRVYQNGQY